ncbi:MAG: chromosome partitioning protein [Phenylobacterium sp.]|jgi:chromosome partitioning protein
MVKSVVIYNHKGGVGKTMMSTNLAYLLATGGVDGAGEKKRVLLVDLDSQQNCSKTFLKMKIPPGMGYAVPPKNAEYEEGDPDNGNWNGISTSSDILLGRDFVYYKVDGLDNLEILPSEGRVESLNSNTIEKLNSDSPQLTKGVSELAAEFLADEEEAGEFDVILFDPPPSKTAICEGFLQVCSHVLIPTELEFDSVDGVKMLMNNIQIHNQQRSSALEVIGIIPNKITNPITNKENHQLAMLSDPDSITAPYVSDLMIVKRGSFTPERKPEQVEKVFQYKKSGGALDVKARDEIQSLYKLVLNAISE